MKKRKLGHVGLEVSTPGPGCMGMSPGREEQLKLLCRINFPIRLISRCLTSFENNFKGSSNSLDRFSLLEIHLLTLKRVTKL